MKIKLCDNFFYKVKDENIDVYHKFNTSKENVLRNNPNLTLYSGEWIKIKQNNYLLHITKPAETLSSVAKLYDINEEKIINDNHLNSNKLFIGQILKIFK